MPQHRPKSGPEQDHIDLKETQGGKDLWHMNQGVVGCTPTNVPLWEIPMGNYA